MTVCIWLSKQYYNQNTVYSTCPSLLTVAASDSIYAGTSVQELSRSTSSCEYLRFPSSCSFERPVADKWLTTPPLVVVWRLPPQPRGSPSPKSRSPSPLIPQTPTLEGTSLPIPWRPAFARLVVSGGQEVRPDPSSSSPLCFKSSSDPPPLLLVCVTGVTLFKYGPDADLQTYIAAVRSAYGSPKRNVAIEAPPLVSPAATLPAARPISPPLGAAVAPLSSTSTVIGDSVKDPVFAPAPAPAPQHTSRPSRSSTSSTRLGSAGADLKSSNDNSDAEYENDRASADDDDEPRHQSKGGHYASSSCDNGDEDDADDYRGGRSRGGGRRDLSSGLAFEGLGGMGGRMVMVRRGRDYRLAVEQERRGRHGGSKGGRCD